jgi:hypothetical protein
LIKSTLQSQKSTIELKSGWVQQMPMIYLKRLTAEDVAKINTVEVNCLGEVRSKTIARRFEA